MPRNIPTDLATHLAGDTTTIAWCWKVTRVKDGVTMGFTTHTDDLVIDGLTYQAKTGASPTTMRWNAGTPVDNLNVVGLISSTHVKDTDILEGRYDGCELEVFIVNYMDLTDGKLTLFRGNAGEAQLNGQRFDFEVRGLSQILQQAVGRVTTPACQVKAFGDAQCKATVPSFSSAITSVTSRRVFTATGLIGNTSFFKFGRVKFTSGNNAPLEREVKQFTSASGLIELQLPFRADVQVGDAFDIFAGCDRSLPQCKAYSNVVNYHGFPYVPGTDRILKVPTS